MRPTPRRRGLISGDLASLTILRSDDASAALEAAQGHDLAIACGGATGAEAADRHSLKLNEDSFLVALSRASAAARRVQAQMRNRTTTAPTSPMTVVDACKVRCACS